MLIAKRIFASPLLLRTLVFSTLIASTAMPGMGASAALVATDKTTSGSWKGVYGSEGAIIANSSESTNPFNVPGIATVSIPLTGVGSAGRFNWENPATHATKTPFALQRIADAQRIASAFFHATSFDIDLNLTDGQTHKVALYSVDWENASIGRKQTIQVLEFGTNTPLASTTIDKFGSGVYTVWDVQGHVIFRVTRATDGTGNGQSAVVSGIFFGANVTPPIGNGAKFISLDTPASPGNWKGKYGQDGYFIPRDPNAAGTSFAGLPSYVTVTTSLTDQGTPINSPGFLFTYTRAQDLTDLRAPEWFGAPPASLTQGATTVTNPARNPSLYYGFQQLTYALKFNDNQPHRVAVYMVDFDNAGRRQTVTMLDGDNDQPFSEAPVQTIENFSGGKYAVWEVTGHVKLRFENLDTNTNPKSFAHSGIFFGGSAPGGPTISITSPPAGPVSGTVTLTANASSPNGNPTVQFKIDNVNFGSPIAAPPYTIQWNSVPGPHTISAVATDPLNLTATASVNVTVPSQPLSVSIVSPANGSTVPGPLTLQANAASPAGMSHVQFLVNGNVFAQVGGSGPLYSAEWPYPGTFTFTATATDLQGQSVVSAPVQATLGSTNPAPTISIVSPAPGSTVAAPVTVRANATAQAGIAHVQFLVNGNVFAQVGGSGPDYSVEWPYEGAFTFTATATDSLGQTTVSAPVQITVGNNPAPTISIVSPAPGSTVAAPVTVQANATAQAGIAHVQFLVNGNVFAQVGGNGPLYSVEWPYQGSFTFTAAATDSLGKTTVSAPVQITVGNNPAPTISIVSPAPGSTVAAPVTVQANATAQAGIAHVQFLVNGNVFAQVGGNGPLYSVEWPYQGSFTFTATATDLQGQTTASAPVDITISNNTPPTISIVSPAPGSSVAAPLTVQANATAQAGIAHVQFLVNGNVFAQVGGSGPLYSVEWPYQGSFTFTATATDLQGQTTVSAPVNATLSNEPAGGPSATFVSFDDTTKGDWKNKYGKDGYLIAGNATVFPQNQNVKFPTYVTPWPLPTAQESNCPPGQQSFVHVYTSTQGQRYLVKPDPAADRIASAYYTCTTFVYDLNLSGGQQRQLAIYVFDQEGSARSQTISILNGETNALLDSKELSNFNAGRYAVWNIRGHVKIQVTKNLGQSAVVAGIFFDTETPTVPPPTISLLPLPGTVDGTVALSANASSAAGIKHVQFKVDGNNVGDPVTGAGPTYTFQWNTKTVLNSPHSITAVATDIFDQTTTSTPPLSVTTNNPPEPPIVTMTAPAAGAQVAGTAVPVSATAGSVVGMSSVTFLLDDTIEIGQQSGPGPTYSIQWNASAVALGAHTLRARARNTSGQETLSSPRAVTVIDPNPQATFLTEDINTRGNWKNIYGKDGWIIPGDTNSIPAYLTLGTTPPLWLGVPSSDLGAVVKSGTTTARIYSAFDSRPPSHNPLVFDLNFTDADFHDIAIYQWDFEKSGRAQLITIRNAQTNAVLASRSVSNFGNGKYAVFRVSGRVLVHVAWEGSGNNALVNAIFFDTPPPPPAVSIVAPTSGQTLTGLRTLTASASASAPATMASVQFRLNGNPISPEVTSASSEFSFQWDSAGVLSGPYSLTAVAKDSNGSTRISAPVAIITENVVGPPVVSFTSPGPNQSVFGVVPLSVNASSAIGVASVQFKVDNVNIGSPVTGTGPIYSTSWDARGRTNGPYTLTAVATDPQGRTSTASITVILANPINSASFVKFDTTTKGNWKNVYGKDGVVIAKDATTPPAGATVVGPAQGGTFEYNILATESALRRAASDNRVAGAFHTITPQNNPYTFDIAFGDGSAYELALYAWDVDYIAAEPRAATISFFDADTNAPLGQSVLINQAAGYPGGVYAVFKVSGHILIRVSNSGARNAMLSGLFFTKLPAPPQVTIGTPTPNQTVSGNSVALTATASANSPATVASVQFRVDNIPAGNATPSGPGYTLNWDSRSVANGDHVLTAVVTDSVGQAVTSSPVSFKTNNPDGPPVVTITSHAPQEKVKGTVTITANAFSSKGIASVQFKVNGINQGALLTGPGPYSVQWNTVGLSGSRTLTAVAKDALGVEAVSPEVSVTIDNPLTTAIFERFDIATKGDWKDASGTVKYGKDGYMIVGDLTSLPTYATVSGPTNAALYTNNNLAPDLSALRRATGTGRSGSVNHTIQPAHTPMVFDINLTDGKEHELALYSWDFDGNRAQSITIVNADTNADITTTPPINAALAFKTGVYSIFKVRGHILVRISRANTTSNAVIGGLFLSTPPPPPAPPEVTIVTPVSGAELTGQVTLTANASAAGGMKSLQFYLDGGPISSLLTNGGPTYTTSWESGGVPNGAHNLTAVATDMLDQSVISGSVTINTNNLPGPPTVTITSPAHGVPVSGSVTVSATATSMDGIASVQFKVNGQDLGSPISGGGSIYSTNWNTAGLSAGTYSLTAVAIDNVGRSKESSPPVLVTVLTSGPFGKFSKTDTTTQGNWKTQSSFVYGSEAYVIPTDSNTASNLNYLTLSGLTGPGVTSAAWPTTSSLHSSVQAPLKGSSTTQRIASYLSTGKVVNDSFTLEFNFTDINRHELALYLWDFELSALRRQKIEIVNPANGSILASWQATAGYSNGIYVVFEVGGHVLVRVTNLVTNTNAVISGIFLKTLAPPPPPPPPPTVSMILPVSSTTPLTGPVTLSATATANQPATIVSVQFRLDGNLIGSPIQNPPYTMQWDSATAINGDHTLTAVATDSTGQSSISGGVHIVTQNVVAPPEVSITAPVSGTSVTGTVTITANATSSVGIASVQFKIKAPGQSQAQNLGAPATGVGSTFSMQWPTASLPEGAYVLTAVATDKLPTPQSTESAAVSVNVTLPANSAVFVKSDTTTMGNWKNANGRVYGEDGFMIPNDSPVTMSPSYSPTTYATVSFVNATTWSPAPNPNTGDARDLRRGSNPAADAPYFRSTYLNTTSFTVNVNMSDTQLHQLALYFYDYDGNRQQIVEILDGDTGDVLVTKSVSNFKTNSIYLVFNVRGKIRVRVTKSAGTNAVLNGMFFRSFVGKTPPAVSITSPTGGEFGQEIVNLVANATSSEGIASVQFQLNGTPIPGTVTNAGPVYTQQWATGTVFAGTYDLTATAVDNLGLSSTSLGYSIKVNHNGGVQPSANFVKNDTETRGNWVGKYGSQGYIIAGVQPSTIWTQPHSAYYQGAKKIPAFMLYDHAADNFADGESDDHWDPNGSYAALNGLQKSPTDLQNRGTYFAMKNSNLAIDQRPPLEFNLKFVDSQEHQVAIYMIDWHHNERWQRVEFLELLPGGAVGNSLVWRELKPIDLDTCTGTAAQCPLRGRGVYAVFNVRGSVRLRIRQFNPVTSNGPVLSGIFIDPKQ